MIARGASRARKVTRCPYPDTLLLVKMPLILPGRWMAVPCASSAAAAAMDLLSAGELAALDQTDSAESANPLDSLGEAPATAPPLWRAEAHAWTPRAHALAVQAAAGPVCFSFIPLPDADAVLSADVELPAQYRAVRAGGCAVRAEAALDSEPAGRIAAGEQVTVTERVELAAAAGADDDGSTRGAVVRLRTEHGWVSELSKKRHPLMIPFHEEPPEDDIASLVRRAPRHLPSHRSPHSRNPQAGCRSCSAFVAAGAQGCRDHRAAHVSLVERHGRQL